MRLLRRVWRGWLAHLALVLGIVGLSFSVMIASAPDAMALAGPINPVTIGESLGGPAVEAFGAATGGGVDCLAGPAGAAYCGGVAIVTALALTAPSWLPMVEGWFGLGGDSSGSADTSSCHPTVTHSDLPGAPGGNITFNVTLPGCPGNWGVNHLSVTRGFCVSSDITYDQLNGSPSDVAGPAGQAGPATFTIPQSQWCGPNGYLVALDMWGNSGGWSGPVVRATLPTPTKNVNVIGSVNCLAPDNSTFTATISVQGRVDQLPVPSCSATTPGSIPTGSVWWSSGWPGHEIQNAKHSLMDGRTFKQQYPGCFNAAGAFLSSCNVKVWINGSPCTVGASHCGNWQVAARDYGDTVECRYGNGAASYVVSMADCQMYLPRAYQPGTGIQTITDPGTKTDPTPRDAGDPAAPKRVPPVIPQTGTNTPHDPAPKNGNPESSSCWGTGWSWNPVDWVVHPAECALDWAFVPSTTTLQTDGCAIQSSFASSSGGAALSRLGVGLPGQSGCTGAGPTLPGVPSGPSGCGGIPFDHNIGIPGRGEVNVHLDLMNACGGSTLAPVAATVNLALTGVLVAATAMTCVRLLGGSFGLRFGGSLGSKEVAA